MHHHPCCHVNGLYAVLCYVDNTMLYMFHAISVVIMPKPPDIAFLPRQTYCRLCCEIYEGRFVSKPS